jgi:hypothetical protein
MGTVEIILRCVHNYVCNDSMQRRHYYYDAVTPGVFYTVAHSKKWTSVVQSNST